jgi:thiamine-phosphate pyrophosphorylase
VMICLVTDRRRLAGPAASLDEARRCLLDQARYAVDAGVDLVQVRERDLEAADLSRLVTEILGVTRGTGTRVVVNDRLDVALACGAGGVHLRRDSVPVAAARQMAPAGFLIGRSVHRVDDVHGAAGADYLVAGTVFPSASKPGTNRWLGVDGLRSIAAAARAPVLAIGGVTADRMEALAAAGAAGFAAIGLFMPSSASIPLRSIVQSARSRFDSVNTAP